MASRTDRGATRQDGCGDLLCDSVDRVSRNLEARKVRQDAAELSHLLEGHAVEHGNERLLVEKRTKLPLSPEVACDESGREQYDPSPRLLKPLIHLPCLALAGLNRERVEPDPHPEVLKVPAQEVACLFAIDPGVAQEYVPLAVTEWRDRALDTISKRLLSNRVARP